MNQGLGMLHAWMLRTSTPRNEATLALVSLLVVWSSTATRADTLELTINGALVSANPGTRNANVGDDLLVNVGLRDSDTITAYTLDFPFDTTELSFAQATQLGSASQGGAALGFSLTDIDAANGQGRLSLLVLQTTFVDAGLFRLQFTVDAVVMDGIVDIEVGNLDALADGIIADGGGNLGLNPLTAYVDIVPEPQTALPLGGGIACMALGRGTCTF